MNTRYVKKDKIMSTTLGGLFSCATCNVAGINRGKIPNFRDKLGNFELLGLNETHGKKFQCRIWIDQLGYSEGIFSLDHKQARGTALMWKDSIESTGYTWTDKKGRIACAGLQKRGSKFVAVSVYAPCLNKSQVNHKQYVDFLIGLEDCIRTACQKVGTKTVIMMGDMNLIFDKVQDSASKVPTVHEVPREALMELLEQFRLKDCFREFNGEEKATTYAPGGSNPKRVFNRLDYIFMSDGAIDEMEKCDHKWIGNTDHKAVAVYQTAREERKGRGLWKHNDTWNNDEDFVERMGKVIVQAKEEMVGTSGQATFEWIKHKMMRYSISRSVDKARKERNLKEKLTNFIENADPNTQAQELAEAKRSLEKILQEEGERAIFRSKCQWVEKGERCTRYFFSLIKQNRRVSNITELEINGQATSNMDEIQEALSKFYGDLFKKNEYLKPCERWYKNVPRLTEEDRKDLSGEITTQEVHNILFKEMHQGKSPGNDGLTVGLYQACWKEIKEPLLNSLREGLKEGGLSVSQKQSVIRLIPKKDRDPVKIKNWRPISLLNVDTKIYAKIIAERLKKQLVKIISPEQLAYVKGRSIHDGNRLINQVISEIEKNKRSKGSVLAIDFSKAFDTLDHDHLWKTLEAMGCGEKLISMIKTLYNGAESAVINNGTTTSYHPVKRSTRQGDPLSPILFAIALEPLLLQIKKVINGVKTPGGVAKISCYADDLTLFISGKEDLDYVLEILRKFAETSGLEINLEKSELLQIGEWKNEEGMIEEIPIVKTMKITGIHIGSAKEKKRLEALNYDPILSGIETRLQIWKSRNLSLVGKVLIVKTQALSKLQFMASATEVPIEYVKKIKKCIYNFIWSGKDRVAREILAKPWEEGGLKMPVLEDFIAAATIHWFRRAVECQDKLWARNFNREFNLIGGLNAPSHRLCKRALQKTEGVSRYTIYLVEQWERLIGEDTIREIQEDTPLWYSKNLKIIRNRGDQGGRLRQKGVTRAKDLFEPDGRIIKYVEANARGLSRESILEWQGAIQSIPEEVKRGRKIKGEYRRFEESVDNCIPIDMPKFTRGEQTVEGKKLTQATVLKMVASNRKTREREHQKKMSSKFMLNDEDWKKINRMTIRHSISTKKREFIFKFVNGITGTNKKFEMVGYKSSSSCTYCEEENQDYTHLFLECPEVQRFRDAINTRILKGIQMTEKDLLFGPAFAETTTEKAEMFVTMESNQYIYRANWAGEDLSLAKFRALLKDSERIEAEIARQNNKTLQHLKKWDYIKECII